MPIPALRNSISNPMHYWKTALLTLVIFGLGGLAGSLITAHVIKFRIEKVEATQPIAGFEQGDFIPRMMHVMEKQLNLQPAQIGRARDIMKRAQQEILRLNGDWRQKASELPPLSPELLSARNEWRLKCRDVIKKSDEAIRGLLLPEQFSLFEEFLRKRRTLFTPNRPVNGQPPRLGDRLPLRAPVE